jgi:hypothetical protein
MIGEIRRLQHKVRTLVELRQIIWVFSCEELGCYEALATTEQLEPRIRSGARICARIPE